MGTLSGEQIIELVKTRKLVIEPVDKDLAQPATYDLRLGHRILASPLDAATLGAIIDLTEEKPTYDIQCGQMVGVISEERIELPLDISGRFGIRSTFARRGIVAFGGLQLDPGFRGRLIMNLLNVGPEPITIKLHEPLFSVEFQRLEKAAKSAYEGLYQDQNDFPADQYQFILSARTTSLAEIPTLRREMARLSVLIEELEELIPDVDAGLELKSEIKQRLLRSSQIPRASLVSADEIRKRLNM